MINLVCFHHVFMIEKIENFDFLKNSEMKNGSSRGLPEVFLINNIWFLWVFDRSGVFFERFFKFFIKKLPKMGPKVAPSQ